MTINQFLILTLISFCLLNCSPVKRSSKTFKITLETEPEMVGELEEHLKKLNLPEAKVEKSDSSKVKVEFSSFLDSKWFEKNKDNISIDFQKRIDFGDVKDDLCPLLLLLDSLEDSEMIKKLCQESNSSNIKRLYEPFLGRFKLSDTSKVNSIITTYLSDDKNNLSQFPVVWRVNPRMPEFLNLYMGFDKRNNITLNQEDIDCIDFESKRQWSKSGPYSFELFNILLKFNLLGKDKFTKLTGRYKTKRYSIVINGDIIISPIIYQEETRGTVKIKKSNHFVKRLFESLLFHKKFKKFEVVEFNFN